MLQAETARHTIVSNVDALATSAREKAYRVRGIPSSCRRHQVVQLLRAVLDIDERISVDVRSLASSVIQQGLEAVVTFSEHLPILSKEGETPLKFENSHLDEILNHENLPHRRGKLHIDSHFLGLTVLRSFESPLEHKADCLAITGLGGHAFGSFKEKDGDHVWLCDSLPDDLEGTRIMIYGYESKVHNSNSFQGIQDLGNALASTLEVLKESNDNLQHVVPLIFIAHSLGGIIVKEAIIQLARSEHGSEVLHLIYGALFFGVPNVGMDIESLIPMVEGQPNGALLHTLAKNSEVLRTQSRDFSKAFRFEDSSEIVCFYETKMSATAVKIATDQLVCMIAHARNVYCQSTYNEQGSVTRWAMKGPDVILVEASSARHVRPWENETYNIHALNVSHSNLVKFSAGSLEYARVCNVLRRLTKEAAKKIPRLPAASEWHTGDEKSAGSQTNLAIRVTHKMDHSDQSQDAEYLLGLQLMNAPRIDQTNFVGRATELNRLYAQLVPNLHPAGRRIAIISGLGGMGKTQLAIAFARNYQGEFDRILWLDARSESSLRHSLLAFANRLPWSYPADDTIRSAIGVNTPRQPTSKDDEVERIETLKNWLSRSDNANWLLIYDNYDDLKLLGITTATGYDVTAYFPYREHGSILVTTRCSGLRFGVEMPLVKLQKEESAKILMKRQPELFAHGDSYAQKIVDRLDGLPLALATAADDLSYFAISPKEYLEDYDKIRQSATKHAQRSQTDGDRTLYTTWSLSLSRIELQDPRARALLQYLSYFDNADIWFELLQPATDVIDDALLRDALSCKAEFRSTMRRLQEHSMVEKDVSRESYSMHNCLHDWTLDWLNDPPDKQLFRAACHCIAISRPPDNDPSRWSWGRRLVQHALRLTSNRFKAVLLVDKDLSPTQIELYIDDLTKVGDVLLVQGHQLAAEEICKLLISVCVEVFGEKNEKTLRLLGSLGAMHFKQCNYVSAEDELERSLAGIRNVGKNYSWVIRNLYHLGGLYRKQSKFEDAKAILLQGLEACEQSPSSDNDEKAEIFGELGAVYINLKDFAIAENYLHRAIELDTSMVGRHGSRTLSTLRILGRLRRNQGRFNEADAILQEVLHAQESLIGHNHPNTLATLKGLALLRINQGRLAEAESILQPLFDLQERIFGRDDLATLRTLRHMGDLRTRQGRLNEAEAIFQQIVASRKKIFGLNHQRTLEVVEKLHMIYTRQGNHLETQRMHQWLVEGGRIKQSSIGLS